MGSRVLIAVVLILVSCGPASWEYVGKKNNNPRSNEKPFGGNPGTGSSPTPVPGTFTVSINPNPTTVNTPISFTAECGKDKQGKVTWTLGNGETREGPTFNYSYTREGSYTVTTTCTEGSGTPETKSTVVVIGAGTGSGGQGGGQSSGQNGSQNRR